MFYGTVRVAFAIAVIVASLPLSLLAMERGFGLAATLTVPTCCLGFWLSLVTPRRSQRIGWFAFSSVCLFLLPTCPWWQRTIEAVLRWVQNLIRGSQPAFLYSGAEAVALLVLIVLPWGVGCLLGWLAARVTRRLLCRVTNADESQCRSEYRFTLRGMFLSIMVCAVQTAWLSSTIRQWHVREETNQEQFLYRFKHSFTTGNVTLLAEPLIAEDHTILKASQNSSGISEYRVIAPINKNGNELWAVWTYLCDENYPGTVSKFGYAEASTQGALRPFPFPVTEYLREPTYPMIDGEPPLATRAEITDAPIIAKAGDTITIVAKTDRYLECDLVIRPFLAVASPPPKTIAPESGVVRWDVMLNPTFRGSQIEYEFQARTNMLYRAKTVAGVVALGKQNGDESGKGGHR